MNNQDPWNEQQSQKRNPQQEAQIKRLFQANVIEGLESEDR